MPCTHPILALALSTLLAAQESPPQSPNGTSLERPGNGAAVCGLGKAFHAGRRAALRAALEEGVVLVRGLPETRGYARFHQDKTFWYLAGVESPDAALVMDAATGAEVLYLPPRNVMGERWEGEKWDPEDAWVSELSGIADVRSERELEGDLAKLLDEGTRVWISKHPHVALGEAYDRARPFDARRRRDDLDGRASREQALAERLEERYGVRVKDMSRELALLRQVKTPEEVDAMRRAGRAGALAMLEAMRSTRPGVGEWELEALMTYVQIRAGASGPAYHGIVGSGPNSLVLHYSSSSRALRSGEVLLIDYAPEVDHYTSDITRTWPVDGAFTERQAEIYDVVLEAQLAGIAAVRPGATLADVEAACDAVIERHGLMHLRAHGACHWIGMEVHDVGAKDRPLELGMAFTVEPGLYEQETAIGIRIEDVVVVTAEGCEVLTADVPKARAALEAAVAARGVVDWLDEPAEGDGAR